MTPVDRTGKPDGAMADQLTLSGMRRSRPALHRELVTGTRHADNWEDAVCSSEAEWRFLNASTFEVVFRTLWSSVSAPWIRIDAQQRKPGADIRLHAFPAIRHELGCVSRWAVW